MCNLTKLQVLQLGNRRLVAVPSFDSLISLGEVVADVRAVVQWSNLQPLTKVKKVQISGCRINLQTLSIEGCECKDLSGLSSLSALKSLHIQRCKNLERLLEIWDCPMLRSWDCTSGQVAQGNSSCSLDDITEGDLSESKKLMRLQPPVFSPSESAGVRSSRAFARLERLECCSLPVRRELPDLSNFPWLKILTLKGCQRLRSLTSCEPINAFLNLNIWDCVGLKALPDLGMFPVMYSLKLYGCSGLTALDSCVPLTALVELNLQACSGLEALPDLRIFPALPVLDLNGCTGLTALSSSVPLTTLLELNLEDCRGLKALLDLGMFPAMYFLNHYGCSRLTALSSSVPLSALEELNLEGCSGLEDLRMFPTLPLLDHYGSSGLTALNYSVPLKSLLRLNLQGCIGLEALPDLEMFPELRVLLLDGCNRLTALRSSVPLAALTLLGVRGCKSLSWDALAQLLASCPGVEIDDALDFEGSDEDGEEYRQVRRRIVGPIADID